VSQFEPFTVGCKVVCKSKQTDFYPEMGDREWTIEIVEGEALGLSCSGESIYCPSDQVVLAIDRLEAEGAAALESLLDLSAYSTPESRW
jgi:hypothetical protein